MNKACSELIQKHIWGHGDKEEGRTTDERSDWSKKGFLLPKWLLIKDKLQVLPFGLRASNVSIEGENTLISTLPLA